MPDALLSVTLHKTEQISSNTLQLSFALDPQASAGFNFIAGQFVQLHFEIDGTGYKRSYSIANTPEQVKATGCLEIALSRVRGGIASEFFRQAEPGTRLRMGGPFGALTLPETVPGQLILAGTGTGIAPYRSMIPQLQTLADKGVPVTVLTGFRNREECIYRQDFAGLSNVSYCACLSRESGVQTEHHEFAGHVQDRFDALHLDPESDLVYLCGNPGMIDDCATLLKGMGFPPRQIKREKYVFSGH